MVDQEMRQESELIEYMEKYKQITIYCDIQKNHVRFVKEIPERERQTKSIHIAK